ncbi:outer membrane lipid asymmetry maintenance protein MlaD [Luteithermobacter gelatinilyticus]|uniref:outer membrane lipid asymmetry maintenance protein MlaD n=1 Tax=Luteithermobacter gelatinilyticus TaxID=2582913 RepID=UPI00110711AC|nr:outer membrane lipid asymmetry maintenance protein MlaD [Luteithermobacter gelatinilyticus]|tara:strand:+ start:20350 stop:20793 length:444 start_codon:yes stop_codon:yes gene_type:complete
MRNNLVETLMGLVVLFVAGTFLYFAYTHANIANNGGYLLKARFNKVDGLSVGSDVRISGIKVGTVVRQFIDPESYWAVVEFTVDPSIKLPEDTFAKITAEGLLGGNYLALDPGGSDEYLRDGDEILDTQGSVDLLGLLDKFAGSDDE